MRRKLFTAASALSLVMFLATLVLWVMGSHSIQTPQFDHDGQRWEAFSRGGALGVDNVPDVQRQLDQRDALVMKMFDAEFERSHYAGELEVYLRDHPAGDQGEAAPKIKAWRDKRDAAKARMLKLKANLASKPWPPMHGFEIRDWWLAVLSSIPPALWILQWRAKVRRVQSGRCAICGYSLTGNTSGICPECGTAVAGKAGA